MNRKYFPILCRQQSTNLLCILWQIIFVRLCLPNWLCPEGLEYQSSHQEKHTRFKTSSTLLQEVECAAKTDSTFSYILFILSQSHAVNTIHIHDNCVKSCSGFFNNTNSARPHSSAISVSGAHDAICHSSDVARPLPKQLFHHDVISSTNLSNGSVWHQEPTKKRQLLPGLFL